MIGITEFTSNCKSAWVTKSELKVLTEFSSCPLATIGGTGGLPYRRACFSLDFGWRSAALRIGQESCPYCHRSDVYVSSPKNLWEELAVLLLLRPVRCHDCMHRFYRPLFIPTAVAPPRSSALKKPTQQTDKATNDKQRLA